MISYISAPGEEVFRIIEGLEDVIEGEKKGVAYLACIAMAVLLEDPNMKPDKLGEAVKGASEWISTYVASSNVKMVN